MNKTLIEEFVSQDSMQALNCLVSTSELNEAEASALTVSDIFGAVKQFSAILQTESDGESKLISSFHNNLVLLIQKTWVEKSDEDLKAQVLYQLEKFTELLTQKSYKLSYAQFFSIVDAVVYLMFGTQTKSKEFEDYALRIDPEFGIFWWYMKSLPKDSSSWSEEKTRIIILLGMYFLANY